MVEPGANSADIARNQWLKALPELWSLTDREVEGIIKELFLASGLPSEGLSYFMELMVLPPIKRLLALYLYKAYNDLDTGLKDSVLRVLEQAEADTDNREEVIKMWKEYVEDYINIVELDQVLQLSRLNEKYARFAEAFDGPLQECVVSLQSQGRRAGQGARSGSGPATTWLQTTNNRPEKAIENRLNCVVEGVIGAMELAATNHVGNDGLLHVCNKYRINSDTTMRGLGKRIDIALTQIGMEGNDWHEVLLDIEVKSCKHNSNDPKAHIGQYAAYAAKKWKRQVRRFMLGGLVLEDTLYLIYCDRRRAIMVAKVGKVFPGRGTNKVMLANGLRMLAFLFTLSETELGFLIEGGAQRLGTIYIQPILTPAPEYGATHRVAARNPDGSGSNSNNIIVQNITPVCPIAKIFSRMSWLYRGKLPGRGQDVYIKFDAQYTNRSSELAIMERLAAKNIPHTPRMLHGFRLGESNGVRFEVMVLEDHGLPIPKFFRLQHSKGGLTHEVVIDIICQAVKALEAASRAKVIHWDISAGNIVVWVHNSRVEATVIDWGYARVLDKTRNTANDETEDALTGTAQFSSIRMLCGYGGRTVIDDLESLFYVVCYAVSYACENKCDKDMFWQEKSHNFARDHAIYLATFMSFSDMLFETKEPRDKGIIRVLEDFYKILFGHVKPRILCRESTRDPRMNEYSEMRQEMADKFNIEYVVQHNQEGDNGPGICEYLLHTN
ncbi:hypothetical protein EV182_003415 [Spiromyces aspiralis]|uniref:Uncharacterized protein n=1 Tax=Spiromyces aspiralis TaxID=68401 RepID=A0ACC1HR84_9FUNG|nr:hypothetical protein EV182_003415 [Spiromyces aspiralis]